MRFYLHISIFCSTFAPAFEKKARKDGGVVYRVGLESLSFRNEKLFYARQDVQGLGRSVSAGTD